MWPFKGKADGLAQFILNQIEENPDGWGFAQCTAHHMASNVQVWTANTWLQCGIWERMERHDVGFTMIQKWKIHRKLNKLKQRLEREAEAKKVPMAQEVLERMVTATLTGEKPKGRHGNY